MTHPAPLPAPGGPPTPSAFPVPDAPSAPSAPSTLDPPTALDALPATGTAFNSGATPDLNAPFAPDALRQLVREVLREVLPAIADQPNPVKVHFTGSGPPETHFHRVPVRLGSDADLHAFVVEILRLADDPQRRLDLLAGRLRFTMAAASGQPVIPKDSRHIWPQILRDHEEPGPDTGPGGLAGLAGAPPTGEPWAGVPPTGEPRAREPRGGEPRGGAALTARRVEKGAVTERAVIAAARAGERLVLGPRAVLTPLARDKARALGVPIEKER
jgi:hypothetical protein